MNILFLLVVMLHITSAVTLVGGTFFYRMLLIKYATRQGGLSDELATTLQKRWMKLAWHFILILVVTGFFLLFQRMPDWKGTHGHMVFGIKFLAFLVAVALLALIGSSKGKKAARRPALMLASSFVGLLIILLSAWLARVN